MGRQFKRIYELVITPEEGEERTITGLRINFDITKNVLSLPNVCRITIANANNDTLSTLQKKYTRITLRAGYDGNIALLFKGDVRNVFQSKPANERLLTVFAADGEKSYQNAIFNKSFSPNIAVGTALEEIMKTFEGVTIGSFQDLPSVADKLRGQSLSGSSKDLMDEFANEYKFDWSIQDGESVIISKDKILNIDEAVVLTSATGMIGSPIITEIGANVIALLNPLLLPNTAFRIESILADSQVKDLNTKRAKRTTAEGLYKIQEVKFKGDSREGDWIALLKGKTLDGFN